MIKAHTAQAAEAGFILAMGDRSDATTRKYIRAIVAAGVECGACGANLAACDEDGGVDSRGFRDAAGVGLCLDCYDEAGLENEHADGGHAPAEGAHGPVWGERVVCPTCVDEIADGERA